MRRWCLGLIAALWLASPASVTAQEELPIVARVGPWPSVSRLIAYDGRIWFVNSVKGVNHNSAEIWSFIPKDGFLRHERHLFSQDAGQPVVHGGLLYWPFEDSRFSVGWGHYTVTDGFAWRLLAIPSARAFHTHAMSDFDGALLATTSAWRAGFQVSRDHGITWAKAYDHPTPDRRVSRITEIAALDDRVLGLLRDPGGRRVVAFDGAILTDLPEVPPVEAFGGFAVFRGEARALVTDRTGQRLWRSEGRRAEPLAIPTGNALEGLSASPEGLWAVSGTESGGLLWFNGEGRDWSAVRRLEGGRPREVLIHEGEPYVAGEGDDGHGILWGPAPTPSGSWVIYPPPANRWPPSSPTREDWTALGADLDRALADPATYRGRGGLRDLVYRAVLAGPPEGFLAARLSAGFPDASLSLIGGAATASAEQLGRWILLWGMALSKTGRVPPALIAEPWRSPPNGAEKYFDTAQAAIWTAGEIGQRDRATLDALVARLDRPGDPDWLAGDVIGALTAITGQHFGFDKAAWREWWVSERGGWPE